MCEFQCLKLHLCLLTQHVSGSAEVASASANATVNGLSSIGILWPDEVNQILTNGGFAWQRAEMFFFPNLVWLHDCDSLMAKADRWHKTQRHIVSEIVWDGERVMRSNAIFSRDGLCPNIPNREVAPAMLRRCTWIQIIAWRPPKKADENYEFASEVAEAITVILSFDILCQFLLLLKWWDIQLVLPEVSEHLE